MNGSFLLDTNIVIEIFSGNSEVIDHLDGKNIFVPSIVLGELYYGAYKSNQVEKNLGYINDFMKQSTILDCNAETSQHYGKIKNKLKAKGQPIPENDVWISALAQEHNLTLVTRDKHFQEVEALTLEKW